MTHRVRVPRTAPSVRIRAGKQHNVSILDSTKTTKDNVNRREGHIRAPGRRLVGAGRRQTRRWPREPAVGLGQPVQHGRIDRVGAKVVFTDSAGHGEVFQPLPIATGPKHECA